MGLFIDRRPYKGETFESVIGTKPNNSHISKLNEKDLNFLFQMKIDYLIICVFVQMRKTLLVLIQNETQAYRRTDL